MTLWKIAGFVKPGAFFILILLYFCQCASPVSDSG